MRSMHENMKIRIVKRKFDEKNDHFCRKTTTFAERVAFSAGMPDN